MDLDPSVEKFCIGCRKLHPRAEFGMRAGVAHAANVCRSVNRHRAREYYRRKKLGSPKELPRVPFVDQEFAKISLILKLTSTDNLSKGLIVPLESTNGDTQGRAWLGLRQLSSIMETREASLVLIPEKLLIDASGPEGIRETARWLSRKGLRIPDTYLEQLGQKASSPKEYGGG